MALQSIRAVPAEIPKAAEDVFTPGENLRSVMTASHNSSIGRGVQPEEPARPIRIGVLLEGLRGPAWIGRLLKDLRRIPNVELELVLVNRRSEFRAPFWRRLIKHRSRLLYLAYTALDRRIFGNGNDPFREVDFAQPLDDISTLTVTPNATAAVDRWSPDTVEQVRRRDLDVIVNLSHRILKGDALHTAKLGVWSLHHGDNCRYRGGPPGFWEVIEQTPVTGSLLQILSEDLDNGTVLAESYSATDRTSVARSQGPYFWKSTQLVIRELNTLSRLGESAYRQLIATRNEPRFYSRPLYKPPCNRELAGPLMWHALRGAKRFIANRLRREQWMLWFRFSPDVPTSLRQFKPLTPPRQSFWADPHVIAEQDRYWIFIEEYLYQSAKGVISVLELDRQGTIRSQQRVLECDYHLSHPFVFHHQGQYFLIPESSANRTVDLYVAEQFPRRWKKVKTILEGIEAVDVTLYQHEGVWWMSAGLAEVPGASTWDELFLFSADSPLADTWTPHPKNPVISDVRRARPAGPWFDYDGRLMRPSQDCSLRYGYGLRMNEITRLTKADYAEREIAYLEPNWAPGLCGIHSWSRDGDLTVVDANRQVSRLW